MISKQHVRWPYTENQLKWRTSLGAVVSEKAGNKRIIIGFALTVWALDKVKKSLSTMLKSKSS